ncbi:unnamed protein product [Boreogadus saida]
MGLEGDKGVCEEDIKHAMQGHLEEGYKFNAASAFCPSDERYHKKPDINDKADILVCVVRANLDRMLKDDALAKMKRITTAARDYGIPQMAILTHIDDACPLVKESIQNVYKSKYIKTKMEQLHNELGIPLSNIFPVKNYHEEIDLDGDIDMLILRAMRQIIQIAKDQAVLCEYLLRGRCQRYGRQTRPPKKEEWLSIARVPATFLPGDVESAITYAAVAALHSKILSVRGAGR